VSSVEPSSNTRMTTLRSPTATLAGRERLAQCLGLVVAGDLNYGRFGHQRGYAPIAAGRAWRPPNACPARVARARFGAAGSQSSAGTTAFGANDAIVSCGGLKPRRCGV
jgi:hypothetical protein